MAVRAYLHQFVFRHVFRGLLHPFFRTEYHGVENIPRVGPVILTPNHVAYLDPFWIGCAVPRPIFFMTWGKPFQVAALRPLLWFFHCFPVNHDIFADKGALRKAQELLEQGNALMIFPEGGRCVSGTIDAFKPGAFRLAIKMGIPIVPVTLSGAHEVWPLARKYPRPGKLKVFFHPPLTFHASTVKEIREKSYEAARLVRLEISRCLDPTRRPADLDETSQPLTDPCAPDSSRSVA